MNDEPAVLVERLGKVFDDITAVDDVSFGVPVGESFGFLGPNGAGKSTTINILCTLLRPTTGGARVAGFDVASHPADVRRHIGLVFQDSTLDEYLTAEEYPETSPRTGCATSSRWWSSGSDAEAWFPHTPVG